MVQEVLMYKIFFFLMEQSIETMTIIQYLFEHAS